MGYLAILAASRGRAVGLAAVAGVALGLAINGLLAAIGVAALIVASPPAFQFLRWAGALFLLYLAWDAWRDPPTDAGKGSDMPASFAKGLITNLLNPKAALFYIAVTPRFIDPASSAFAQGLGLNLLHVLVATIIHACIVIFAAQSRALFADPAREQFVRRSLALLLAAVALWFLWETA